MDVDFGSYDYVIVGVGSVGCVLVNWLSVDFGMWVLLFEVGGLDVYYWICIFIGYIYCIGNLCIDWMYFIVFVLGFGGCSVCYLCGKVLGGCLLINGMIYMCGQVQDYDGWWQQGCIGWGWDDVLLWFCKFEVYFVGGDDMYGGSGEMLVELQCLLWCIFDSFCVVVEVEGILFNFDFNCGDNEGVGYFYVIQWWGWCWNVVDGFLCLVMCCVNLCIVIGVQVERLVFDGWCCMGLEFIMLQGCYCVMVWVEVILLVGVIGLLMIL